MATMSRRIIAVAVWAAAVLFGEAQDISAQRLEPLTFNFVPSQDYEVGPMALGWANRTVIDAPYAADAITVHTRVLTDGTRILQESTAAIYRDSRGRMRRELRLGVNGPLAAGKEARNHVVITDPEGGVSYLLDTERKRAVRMRTPTLSLESRNSGHGTMSQSPTFTMFSDPFDGSWADTPTTALPAVESTLGTAWVTSGLRDGKQEHLGTQVIDGVEVEGTRWTATIPAGHVDNDRDIAVVSERWVSPQLNTLVKSREVNPMLGETSFELRHIILTEPVATLFEVPSDFEIIDSTTLPGVEMR